MRRTHPLHGLAGRFGLSAAARRFYHDPINDLRKSIREGGPFQQARTELARKQMVVAAASLPPLAPPDKPGALEVSFLSGANYWYQTIFCIYSLQLHSPVRINPRIHDDGTFTEANLDAIAKVVPWAQIVSPEENESRLDDLIPTARFPTLRTRRIEFPLLRKLCDVRLGREWVLFLDSDMLFFRTPTVLLEWLAAPVTPCYMVDVVRAYGYSPELMRELSGHQEPERVNTGICGLHGGMIDWERVEYWCRKMLEKEQVSYLQEQALTAMLLAGQTCLRLSEEDYRVLPSSVEGKQPTAVLHHYVAHSKRSYFQHGWRRVLADMR